MGRIFPPKDPGDNLDYGFDFSAQMAADNDTVASLTSVTATPVGLTVSEEFLAGAVATFRLSGGVVGFDYTVTAVIVTTGGNTFVRSGTLFVMPL